VVRPASQFETRPVKVVGHAGTRWVPASLATPAAREPQVSARLDLADRVQIAILVHDAGEVNGGST
jgi:hypothetical protein